MPVSVNMPRCAGLWEEQDVNLYNAYPYFIAANQYQTNQYWGVWDKVTGTIPWEPNMGTVLKGVNVEQTPVSRQILVANPYTQLPMKDVISQRERVEQETLYRHNFESPLIHWLPSFKDWRQNQMDPAVKDISRQITISQDQFYRGKIFEKSPYVWICGAAPELTSAPIGQLTTAMTGVDSKNLAWLATTLATIAAGVAGTLSLRQVYKIFQSATNDLDIPPGEGASNMPKDGQGYQGKWVLVTSTDAAGNWVDDPYLKTMKPLDLDTPHDGFFGDLFGNIRIKYERWPLRFKTVAGQTPISIPAPQTYETNPAAVNYGETIPNPAYVQAEYEVAWFMGAESYRTVKVGPPPKEFSSGRMSVAKFNKLQWNGEARVTDNVLRQCLDINGATVLDTNKYGELLQIIADAVFGIVPLQRRYCVPILFRRTRVDTTRGDTMLVQNV